MKKEAEDLVISSILGSDKPAYTKYTDSPEAAVWEGCRAVINLDESNLEDIIKVANTYHVEDKIIRFAKKASQYKNTYVGDIDKYPVRIRREIANESMSDDLRTSAYRSTAIPDTQNGVIKIAERMQYTNDDNIKHAYYTVAKAMAMYPSMTVGLCEVVKELDKKAEYYKSDPLEDMYFRKTADDMEEKVKVGPDKEMSMKVLVYTPKEVYVKTFGSNVAESIFNGPMLDKEKVKMIMPTMSRTDAEIFEKYVK